MANLKDIAKEAGVSIMTVSNVVNGKFTKVSKKNIETIERLVERYHYVPNSAARALSSKNSKIVALIVPSADHENPHNVRAFNSIARVVNERGYYLMVFSNVDTQAIYSNIKTWNIDGVICFAPLKEEDRDFFGRLKIPTCLIDGCHDSPQIMKVGIDDYRGGYLAGSFLAKNGHTSIGFASYRTDFAPLLQERLNGFMEALTVNGLTLKEEHVFTAATTLEGGVDVVSQMVTRNVSITAIFATEDEMAIGIMEGARMNGIDVPGQLSVIGFDNIPLCEYVTPKLTTISQDIGKKGECAATLLIDRIEHAAPGKQAISLPIHIVERQSVRHVPGINGRKDR